MIIALHSTLRDGAVPDYLREHARIPDDLRAMFDRLGVRDWAIWRSGDRLFHLVECDDWDRVLRESAADPANIRWQQYIGQFVAGFYDTNGAPTLAPLDRVWSLAEQRRSPEHAPRRRSEVTGDGMPTPTNLHHLTGLSENFAYIAPDFYPLGMQRNGPTVFTGPTGRFVADTCATLRDAGERGKVSLYAYGRGAYPGTPLEPDILPQLVSIGSWEATTDQDWGLDWHRNEGVEFTCVTAGSVSFSCEDREYELGAGDVTITRPWQLHRIGRPHITSSTLTWFIVDVGIRRPNQDWTWPAWLPIADQDLARLTELLSHNERHVWHSNSALLAAVNTLDRTLRGQMSQTMSRVATATSSVLIELCDLLEAQSPILTPYLTSTERTVKLFLEHLSERLDEPWTVKAMAAECGLGRTRFVHYCKQLLNVAPVEHLTTLRIRRAATLLAQTGLRVTDIAHMCGFQSSQYFATMFRNRMHCKPLEHRQRYRSDGQPAQPVAALA